MKMILPLLLLISLPIFAQKDLSEKEVSDMCMNQIISGLVDDGILGGSSGLCVKMNKDPAGNISAMDFNMQSSAFDSGKDSITDPATLERLKKIKSLILGYQSTITKNDKLTMDDIDMEVHSYADGVGGPKGYDDEIRKLAKDGKLGKFIADDTDSIGAIKSAKVDQSFNFDTISDSDKSLIRNIVLGKKRSQTICKELGGTNCDKKNNMGFASPKLEAEKKDCAERRVSLIRVNLDKIASKGATSASEFHPQFSIPKDPSEQKEDENNIDKKENLKQDMQLAASFEMLKHHKEVQAQYADQKVRDEFLKNETNPHRIYAMNSFSPTSESFSLLDLPKEVLKEGNYLRYNVLLSTFADRYSRFKRNLKVAHEDLIGFAESGNFIEFKKRVERIIDPEEKKKVEDQLRIFTATASGDESTDYYNFFSAGQAIQYQLMTKSHSPYLKNAGSFMNGSNAELVIKMDAKDVMVPHQKTKIASLPWQCQGGCESGIKEGPDGQFMTELRENEFTEKTSAQMNEMFKTPTSFGALKTLNVYTIRDCANCDCLRDPKRTLDSVLDDKSGRVSKTSIDKFTTGPDGQKSFQKKVDGLIEDPMSTCIFTPPVAHTCKVMPVGTNLMEVKSVNSVNYSCPYWDTKGKEHGLKSTVNFINDVLGVVSKTGNGEECRQKILPLKEKAATAICEQSEPAKDACLSK